MSNCITGLAMPDVQCCFSALPMSWPLVARANSIHVVGSRGWPWFEGLPALIPAMAASQVPRISWPLGILPAPPFCCPGKQDRQHQATSSNIKQQHQATSSNIRQLHPFLAGPKTFLYLLARQQTEDSTKPDFCRACISELMTTSAARTELCKITPHILQEI